MTKGREAPDPKDMCHWHCCQKYRLPVGRLCKEHHDLSRVLKLPIW